MRRRINVKWLTGSVVLFAALAGGAHWLHGKQVQRNAGGLLARADRAEQEGDLGAAAGYLERYVALAPGDHAALARYALLLDRQAKTPRDRLAAFFALEKVLRQAPDRHDVRRQLVRVAVALQRHADARDHLTMLLEAFPDDAELEDMLGQCAEANAQFAEAAAWYDKATRHGPARVECYARRAELLRRRLDRADDADGVMDQLIEANPESVPAYLARARYRQRYHSADLAAEDVAFARENLAGDDADLLLLAAELDIDRRRPKEARGHLERGTALYPANASFVQALARLELQAGRRDEAARLALRALPAVGDDPRALGQTADLLIDVREYARARDLLARLEKSGAAPALLDYLHGRLSAGEGRWAEARRLLERARPNLAAAPDLLLQAHLLLAECHRHLGNPDLSLAAYRSAVEADGSSVPARLGLAAATAAAGQTDDAVAQYLRLAYRVPGVRLLALRLLVQRQLRLPAGRRDWAEVERGFRELPDDLRRSAEGRLLWADVLAGQDRVKDARDSLAAARAEDPKRPEYPLALAALAARGQRYDEAAALLAQAERDLGDSVDLRLARAALAADLPGKAAHDRLRALADDKGIRAEEQPRLWSGLMAAALRGGDHRLARELGERLAKLRPGDLEVRLTLFRVALHDGDAAAAGKLGDEMRQIEGEDGTLWRYAEAARRVRFAAADDRAGLAEARARLAEVSCARPSWAPAALLEAELCEREGNLDGAIEHYRRAVTLGERQPRVVRRVVQMLNQHRRFAEAQAVLRQLQEQAPLSADLGRLAAEVSLSGGQAPGRTLDLARQAAAADPGDFRSQLWLGQILAALDKPAEAEAALRRAVQLKPDVPDTWLALVLFLSQARDTAPATAALAEADKKLGRAWTPLAKALCLEALGERGKAQEQYKAALAAAPKDAGLVRAAVACYLRGGQLAEAQELLRRLLAGDPDDGTAVWARRQLALCLAAGGSFPKFKEALALLDKNLKRPNPAAEDQRMRAIVLAMQPARRRESITALEQSFARLPATPDEQFLLAQLYDADRDWPKARGHLLDLMTATEGKNALYLAYFVNRLLHHHQAEEAEHWLQRLTRLEPDSWRTVQATARLWAQQGKAADAARLVREFARKAGGRAWVSGALLLEEVGQKDAAEEMYRQYLADSKQPEGALALATHLAKRGRLDEALDLCEKAAAECPPEAVASVTGGVARADGASEAVIKRVERWLTAAREKKPDSVGLMLALADLRDLQGRVADAEALYRQVLRREPNNPVACNNLAVILALQKKAKEALELSERALEAEGPSPYFLDTRGLVHLAGNRGEQAVRDLEEAVALHPTAPRYFHLAQAHRAAKNRGAADAAWAKAKSLGLAANVLHPLERPAFERLAAELDGK